MLLLLLLLLPRRSSSLSLIAVFLSPFSFSCFFRHRINSGSTPRSLLLFTIAAKVKSNIKNVVPIVVLADGVRLLHY